MRSTITKQAIFFLTMAVAVASDDAIDNTPGSVNLYPSNAQEENGGLRGTRSHLRRPDSALSTFTQIDDQDDDDLSHYESFDQLHFAKSLGFALWDDEESPEYSRGSRASSSGRSSPSSSSEDVSSSESKSKKASTSPSSTSPSSSRAPTSAPTPER